MANESIPTPIDNPLSAPGWPHEFYPDVDARILELANLTSGINAVAQILRNNERLENDNLDSPECTPVKPLTGFIAGGLQSALAAMAFQAYSVAWDLADSKQKSHAKAGQQS